MPVHAEAPPGEVVITPDPIARSESRPGRGLAQPRRAVHRRRALLLLPPASELGRHADLDPRHHNSPAFLAAAFAGLVAYDLFTIEVQRDEKQQSSASVMQTNDGALRQKTLAARSLRSRVATSGGGTPGVHLRSHPPPLPLMDLRNVQP